MSFYRKHPRSTLNTGTIQITKQSHKDECDIHRILKQYQRTGIITHVKHAQAQFLTLPDHQDFQQSLSIIREGEQAFASLPATVRAHFDNDPQRFLEAFYDPNQVETLRGFGLISAAEAADSPKSPGEPVQGDPTA